MLEIHSIRRDWSRPKGNLTGLAFWYILYRTAPGMWESITIEAEDEATAALRLKALLGVSAMVVRSEDA